jgi:hypothetical protein
MNGTEKQTQFCREGNKSEDDDYDDDGDTSTRETTTKDTDPEGRRIK